MENKNIVNIYQLVSKSRNDVGKRLKRLREILSLSKNELHIATDIGGNTIGRIEDSNTKGSLDKNVFALIFFYGYSLENFFLFGPEPTKEELIKQIEAFHEAHNSKAYKIIYKEERPDIKIIKTLLEETDLFSIWVDPKTVYDYSFVNYNYKFTNISASLLDALEMRLIQSKQNPKAGKKKHNLYKKR